VTRQQDADAAAAAADRDDDVLFCPSAILDPMTIFPVELQRLSI